MKALLFLLGALVCVTSIAEEPPKWTQMQKAIMGEPDLAQVKTLLESGADPNAPIGCGTFSPLDGAINRQKPELVDLRLSLGARPTEAQLVRAAFCALHGPACQMAISLHRAGVSINAVEFSSDNKDRFSSALHSAVWRGNTQLVDYILKQKDAHLDEVDHDGFTPLMIAVDHGRSDIVAMLLAAGADPLKKNQRGENAASIADKLIALQKRLKTMVTPAG